MNITIYPKDTKYLLPILTNDADDRQTYKKLSKRINRHLRLVGEMVQLPIPLTLYVARHSWASIAKQKHLAALGEWLNQRCYRQKVCKYTKNVSGFVLDL